MSWQPIETAPLNTSQLVAVMWKNRDGDLCHDLDHTEDGCWIKWHEHAEHTEIVGGHGVSYTPPYTHWMSLGVLTQATTASQCAQCKKEYKQSTTTKGCPKCAPGLVVQESDFQQPINQQAAHGVQWQCGPQATGFAAPQAAPAVDKRAEAALLQVLAAVQRYLPPDGPSEKDTLSEIIGIVDPWPLDTLEKS
jgi:hypothetical protein